MGDRTLELPKEENEHFIAETITSTLKKKLEVNQDTRFPLTYLPYLQEKFISDYDFLASKPSYLLEQITNFLSLYSFLYVSQIALNIKEWRAGIPKSKPLYFVVDTEKVSSERNKVIDLGWKSFEKVSNNLFPMLSTLQLIQNKESRKPIWQIYSEMLASDEHSQFIDCLDNYCERFVEARALRKSFIKSPDIESAFEQLFDLTLAQFDKQWADPSTTRYQANGKVVAALKEHTAKGFVKSKGRIGNILALTQDNLLLITNLIIGDKKQIRFTDLIDELRIRGIYFDETSEDRLIEFYERIGNVERMSDSGDDLYVRQTV
jgi:DNA phosphorothioation-dependent restriction protein DptG